jgi:hypothetical protein
MAADNKSFVMTPQDSPSVQGSILDRTLQFLLSHEHVRRRQIVGVYLTNYFTVVRLDDDSVGACMSSFKMSLSELEQNERSIRDRLLSDPLLLGYIGDCCETVGIGTSIKAAVANALSAPMLRFGGDDYFSRLDTRPNSFFSDINYAVVIGWGGLLEFIIRRTTTMRIHVSELDYEVRQEKIDAELNKYQAQYPYLDISVSNGADVNTHLSCADFVAITGSTFGNNTLDELLRMSRNCGRIILQGQSAGIHPRYVFEAGVSLVATSIKPVAVAEAAEADRTGRALRPFLEGSLPRIYLQPRTAALIHA